MTHYPILVCMPADTDPLNLDYQLSAVLDRWNENREVEPYRRYIDGSPESFWWVEHVRTAAQHLREGTGIKPYNPQMLASYSTAESRQTPEDQRAEHARDANWSARLGEHPTWEHVVRLYNERYCPHDGRCESDDATAETLYYDRDADSAFEIATVNPEGRWDWWAVGGRWWRYFLATGPDPSLIDPGNDDEAGDARLRCNGGPIRCLDLDTMRAEAAQQANHRYDQWETVSRGLPPAEPWSHFTDLIKVGDMTVDQARRSYHEQEVISRAQQIEGFLNPFGPCPVDEFFEPREEYVAEARRAAVPGYALVTLDGRWLSPGEMGWFGASSDGPGERNAYRTQANGYLNQLNPETILVVVDCHI